MQEFRRITPDGQTTERTSVRFGRRAILSAGLASLAPVPARAAASFRERLPALRLGANVERWFTIASSAHARRLGVEWWRGLRRAGFDHARTSLPRFQEMGAGQNVPRLFAEAARDATAAGVPIIVAVADILYEESPWGEAHWRQWDRNARTLADGTDPAWVALAPVNEPAFRGTASWQPVRDRLLAELRRIAPRHTLAWGGHEWCSWRSLLPMAPPGDSNTVAEVHDYVGGSPAEIERRFGQVAAWRDRHRCPTIVSELGGNVGTTKENVEAWADDLSRLLPPLERLELPATLWAFTHGGHWRLQEGEAPQPRPAIAAGLALARRAAAGR